MRPRPGRLAGVRAVLAMALLLFLQLQATSGMAAGRHAGRIVLSLAGGGTGPLELAPAQGGWVGTFTVTNVGLEPLTVSRIALRGDELDVRSPSRLSVHFADGPTTSAVLAPGAAKEVVVAWMPDRDPRVVQAFGQVVVTSTDEEAGEVAMGFRARLPTGLGWVGAHVLTLLVVVPLLVLFFAAALRALGRRDDPALGTASIAVISGELLLATWAYQRFAPGVGLADGNDGYQLVERAVWIRSLGAEWYVGVDGVNVALVLATATVALAALVVSRPPMRRSDAYFSAFALLLSAVLAALVALDGVVLVAAWGIVVVGIVMLVGGWGGVRAFQAGAKAAVYGALGVAALVAALGAMSRASGRTFLVDGTAVAHTLAIPELARTLLSARSPLLGVPFADALWLLLFVPAAVLSPALPLHGWLPDALEEAPPGAAILIAGATLTLGPFLLLRVGIGSAGEGAPWAGPWVGTLGVVVAVYGAFGAMAQKTLRRFVAFSCLTSAGVTLCGIGSLTPVGIGGSLAGLFARSIACALLLGVAGVLESHARSAGRHHSSRVRASPALSLVFGAGLAVSLGVPCFAGFWGPLLVVLGTFASHPAMALLLACAFVAFAAAHVRIARMLLEVSPHAPPVHVLPRELAVLAPLVLLALLLGVWPAPLLAQIGTGATDASAAAERGSGGP